MVAAMKEAQVQIKKQYEEVDIDELEDMHDDMQDLMYDMEGNASYFPPLLYFLFMFFISSGQNASKSWLKGVHLPFPLALRVFIQF